MNAHNVEQIESPASSNAAATGPNESGVVPQTPALPQRVLQILAVFWVVATPFAVASAIYGGLSPLLTVASVFGSVGAVGTRRQLYWGQALLLCAHVFVSIFLLFESVPDWDAKADDLTRLQFVVTTQVPRPMGIALVVVICSLPIIPLLFVARPSTWYRRAWW
jgi:hypothetical protein